MKGSTEAQQLTITLPAHLVEEMRTRITAGEYASEGELIEDALAAAMMPAIPETELEEWIATEGVRRYDAMRSNPARGLTSDEVFASLEIEPEEFTKAG